MKTEKNVSIMKMALGDQWERLDGIVKKHYEMAPGRQANVTIHGRLDQVFHSYIAKLFLIPGRIFGALVPYQGKNIPTTVRNWTREGDSKAMFWHRVLQFPGKPQTEFKSRMEYAGGDEIIEFVKYGLGIRMRMSVKEGALVFTSAGYVWDMGAARVPIPSWVILGDAEIIEKGVSEKGFYIDFNMVHPIFGHTFGYSGMFTLHD
jgi:hypothetical protein